jgi:hypothetical protein
MLAVCMLLGIAVVFASAADGTGQLNKTNDATGITNLAAYDWDTVDDDLTDASGGSQSSYFTPNRKAKDPSGNVYLAINSLNTEGSTVSGKNPQYHFVNPKTAGLYDYDYRVVDYDFCAIAADENGNLIYSDALSFYNYHDTGSTLITLHVNQKADGSWVICRFSGTEPLLRLAAEGNTQSQAQNHIQCWKAFLEL